MVGAVRKGQWKPVHVKASSSNRARCNLIYMYERERLRCAVQSNVDALSVRLLEYECDFIYWSWIGYVESV